MKNTQIKGVIICIIITFCAIGMIFFSSHKKLFAGAFIGVFTAFSSFVITLLFASRANSMSKMLKGINLIASWEYQEVETIGNICKIKEENKGLWFMAVTILSFIAAIIILVVGIAVGEIGVSVILILIIIAINILFINIYLKLSLNSCEKTFLKQSEIKKKYVFISSSGIYAHGILHVWSGWGSRLKNVQYNKKNRKLSFTYSYLKPYSFGLYTVEVCVPEEKLPDVQGIINSFKTC